MGEGIAYGGLLFPDTGCPVPDVTFIMCLIWFMLAMLFQM